jgi:hypothetical protein
MSAEDYIFDVDFDMDEAHNNVYYKYTSKICKICGKTGLHWENIYNTWKLCDMRSHVHECIPQVINIGVFKNASNRKVS